MKRAFLPCVVVIVAACSDLTGPEPRPQPDPQLQTTAVTAQALFERYVALGTSNTMGVQAAGVYTAAQQAAWPAQLAARVGVPYALPLIADPGCPPPLLSPLAANLVLVAAFAAFGAGEDLVSAVGGVCMPLRPGVTLPARNVAISGARTRDALRSTPEMKGPLYSRILPSGHTQVTAMLAQEPTFVSVEFGANEVLPAATGLLAAVTPFAEWAADYDDIIAAVRATDASAVLVGLPSRAENFPSLRRARELFNEWPALLALGITVSSSCYFSSNHIFVPGYLLTLLSKAPTRATCADVPGTVDYVVTAAEVRAIDELMQAMNAHIRSHAEANEYAYFDIDAVYGQPKPRFRVLDVLFSSTPFGAYMSLDGVHPNAAGQGLLAAAAAEAIRARYGVSIP